ncbi:MAG: spore germination protein [Planctomycetes bacterium]|nr:spore germination protein [Planctomycetota bacterium]
MNKQRINEINVITDLNKIEQAIRDGRLTPRTVYRLMMVHIKAYQLAVKIESEYAEKNESIQP